MIKLKRIYDVPDDADGLRILVMRLWPRGIRKDKVDRWLKELGADRDLLRAWKAGEVNWPERRERYLAGLERPEAAAELDHLRALARDHTVTLMCACKDERECHRSLLRDVLESSEEGGRR